MQAPGRGRSTTVERWRLLALLYFVAVRQHPLRAEGLKLEQFPSDGDEASSAALPALPRALLTSSGAVQRQHRRSPRGRQDADGPHRRAASDAPYIHMAPYRAVTLNRLRACTSPYLGRSPTCPCGAPTSLHTTGISDDVVALSASREHRHKSPNRLGFSVIGASRSVITTSPHHRNGGAVRAERRILPPFGCPVASHGHGRSGGPKVGAEASVDRWCG